MIRGTPTSLSAMEHLVKPDDLGGTSTPFLGNLHIDNIDGILVGIGNFPKQAELQVNMIIHPDVMLISPNKKTRQQQTYTKMNMLER